MDIFRLQKQATLTFYESVVKDGTRFLEKQLETGTQNTAEDFASEKSDHETRRSPSGKLLLRNQINQETIKEDENFNYIQNSGANDEIPLGEKIFDFKQIQVEVEKNSTEQQTDLSLLSEIYDIIFKDQSTSERIAQEEQTRQLLSKKILQISSKNSAQIQHIITASSHQDPKTTQPNISVEDQELMANKFKEIFMGDELSVHTLRSEDNILITESKVTV